MMMLQVPAGVEESAASFTLISVSNSMTPAILSHVLLRNVSTPAIGVNHEKEEV
jgi:hypothetical protein